jgi:hypothetical protein
MAGLDPAINTHDIPEEGRATAALFFCSQHSQPSPMRIRATVGPKGKFGKAEVEVPDGGDFASAARKAMDEAVAQAKRREAEIKSRRRAYRRKKTKSA